MKILARVRDEGLRQELTDVARERRAELVDAGSMAPAALTDALRAGPDIAVVEAGTVADLTRIRAAIMGTGAALLIACHDAVDCGAAIAASPEEWIRLPTPIDELRARLDAARQRAETVALPRRAGEMVELLRYEEMLFDRLTGFPTLPVVIPRARDLLDRHGELIILYIHHVWYAKIEDLHGWQKLDEVIGTSAAALRDFCARERGSAEAMLLLAHAADDDFIIFAHMPDTTESNERRLRMLGERLETFARDRIDKEHGREIAALGAIYVGTTTLFRNPKIRLERLIYRGIREAAEAARGAEEWERTRKIADLRATIREGAVFMEYHPIIVTGTEAVYGYEALARGARAELRSPEVLFDVAAQANLVWELSRLLRRRAVDGILDELGPDQLLFLNIDPHDFDDPLFRGLSADELGIDDAGRIVLEITERTAIRDYPRFQQHLAHFRERGFRFAVDDAGSGYAGLGSIANLAPDYIKLDISLISDIDTNFLKQNLVETMVKFAEAQGIRVVAEGVERREEFETVRQLGVHLSQGFLFHKLRYAGLNA